jgi:uncharacterized protein DUF6894
MPRHFFHISNGHPKGEELQDDYAAWAEALRTVRDVEWSLNLDGSSESLEVKRGETSFFGSVFPPKEPIRPRGSDADADRCRRTRSIAPASPAPEAESPND